MVQRLIKAIGALGVSVLMLFGLAQTASAATKTVTISVGDWDCRVNNQYSGSVARALIDMVPRNNPPPSFKLTPSCGPTVLKRWSTSVRPHYWLSSH